MSQTTEPITFQAGALPAAALATRPAEKMSARYEFISTAQVIEEMAAVGYVAHGAIAARRRAAGALAANPAGQHIIDFRDPTAKPILGVLPRLLFRNSHDGSRAASFSLGAFRLVCANGLVTGIVLASASARHTGDAARAFVRQALAVAAASPALHEQIARWTERRMTAAEQIEFARLAMQLRWGRADLMAPEDLLAVRRPEDAAPDVWSVFNRVQEATVALALEARTATGRRMQTRPLLGAAANYDYNGKLWRLAEEFSRL